MSYLSHFTSADRAIAHIAGVVSTTTDPDLLGQYAGFAAVSAITVYELAIGTIFIDYATRRHKVFGHFVEAYFEKINGRIKLPDLRGQHLGRFGDRFVKRFDKLLAAEELRVNRITRESVKESYSNLIQWRHEFAHDGRVPTNATFQEVSRSYQCGKGVLSCLATTLK